jgi:hypothetical protein
MGISFVYRFHENNDVARQSFLPRSVTQADRGRLPSSPQQVARVEHEMSFGGALHVHHDLP